MVACNKYKRYTGGLGQLCCAVEEVRVCATAAVVALVLVDVAKAEDDAGLGDEVSGTCRGEAYLLGAVLAHVQNVVHDGGHVLLAGAVVSAALVDVAVGEEHGAEPHVLDETEAVGLVVIGEHLYLVVVNGGSRGVGGHLVSVDGETVDHNI